MSNNILVTGGAGFIGSTAIKEAIQRGYKVFCLDHRNDLENLNGSKNIHLIKGDVRNKNILQQLFSKYRFDGVVHLAAVSRVVWGEEDPERCWDINVNGTKTLLDSLKINKQRPWFIFGSSREVYGENGNFPISENHKKSPINIYGDTKLMGENMVEKWARDTGNSSVVLRFSNVYGNENDILDRVIPRFVLRALKGQPLEIHGGKQLIDFTHVSDTVNAIFKTIDYIEESEIYFDDFHILPGCGTTLQDAACYISDEIEQEPEIVFTKGRDYDVDRFVGDPSKADSILDFKAKIMPKEGISKTVKRYQEVFGL